MKMHEFTEALGHIAEALSPPGIGESWEIPYSDRKSQRLWVKLEGLLDIMQQIGASKDAKETKRESSLFASGVDYVTTVTESE